jgi:glutathione S-transferase
MTSIRTQKPDESWRLLILTPSHYCEKARWALLYAGLRYGEEAHLPGLHARVNKRVGAGRTVPVLVTPTEIVDDSTKILHFVDTYLPPERRLFPEDPAQRSQVEAWEEEFDTKLGPAVRRWLYFHILPDAKLTAKLFGIPASGGKRFLWNLLFPILRFGMRKSMNITKAKAEKDRERVFAIFDKVGEALRDGRRYLVGDRLTAADLTFASLAAPCLLAPKYGAILPSVEETPAILRDDLTRLREHPAGVFLLRLYSEDRP